MKKYSILLLLGLAICQSCCLFSSAPCFCDIDTPYINNEAVMWVEPFGTEELIFSNSENIEIIVTREHIESSYFIGGDECGSSFPYYLANFLMKNTGQIVLQTTALKDEIAFWSKDSMSEYPPDIHLASFDLLTEKFSYPDDIELTVSDTIIDTEVKKLFYFKNKGSRLSFDFEELKLVKGIGVISFLDNSGVTWVLK